MRFLSKYLVNCLLLLGSMFSNLNIGIVVVREYLAFTVAFMMVSLMLAVPMVVVVVMAIVVVMAMSAIHRGG